MGLTLLIDLDNTLIGNDMDSFLPAYFQGLSRCFAVYVEPDKMVQALIHAIQKMIENNSPDQTLKEIFDRYFYPALNIPYEVTQAAITQFYAHEYKSLQSLTQVRQEAISLVHNALQLGYRIVVATNPLYPQAAISERLNWAGLSPEDIPFDHITNYENYHFAKPNPAYYAEIMARLGWPEGPVMMVGDDWERDIQPAISMGFYSFWLKNDEISKNNLPRTVISGSLESLIPWLNQTDITTLAPSYNSPTAIHATLRATPAALAAQLVTLPDSTWNYKESPENWSLTEIVCHMRDVEQRVNIPRLQQILSEENPFITGIDTYSWVETYQYSKQNGQTALQDFITYRLETLEILESLTDVNWQTSARHAIFGPTNLQEVIHFMAEHDRLHIRQIRPLISST